MENYKNKSHPKWEDYSNYQGFERQYSNFYAFAQEYTNWYLVKSEFFKLAVRKGLFLAMFMGLLWCGGGVDSKYTFESDWLLISSLLVLTVAYLPEIIEKNWHAIFKIRNGFMGIFFLIPELIDKYTIYDWHEVTWPLAFFGLGISLIFYLLNRLEGYTRAWSRYRTAGMKAKQVMAKYQSGLISEAHAHRLLHEVIAGEVEARHKEIVSDFNFFGDKVHGIVSKKVGL